MWKVIWKARNGRPERVEFCKLSQVAQIVQINKKVLEHLGRHDTEWVVVEKVEMKLYKVTNNRTGHTFKKPLELFMVARIVGCNAPHIVQEIQRRGFYETQQWKVKEANEEG